MEKEFVALPWREFKEISDAVEALGYSQDDILTMWVDYHSHKRWRVEIPGKLDGVYDLDRHTFVD